jgi:diguanylate cyclase (GGDEF)-like protein
VLARRATARTAIAGLALGVFTLAGITLWSTHSSQEITRKLQSSNEIADGWGQVFQHLNLEDEAAGDYLRAGNEFGRLSVESAIGSAAPNLALLQRSGGPAVREEVELITATYESYGATLRQMIEQGRAGRTADVAATAEQADLAAASLRKQVTAAIARQRLETSTYLVQADQNTQRVRRAAIVTFSMEVVLLCLCAFVLLESQRRLERHAASSREQALHDSLTGLPNRLLLADRTEHAVRAANRSGHQLGMLLLDLDRFKEVNDTLGHAAGDVLLQTIAERIRSVVRDVDTVARLGGDEFAVLLPDVTSAEAAVAVSRRVISAIRRPVDVNGDVVDVGVSIGISVYPDDSTDYAELLKHADIAMYAAKRALSEVAVYRTAMHNSPALVTE